MGFHSSDVYNVNIAGTTQEATGNIHQHDRENFCLSFSDQMWHKLEACL